MIQHVNPLSSMTSELHQVSQGMVEIRGAPNSDFTIRPKHNSSEHNLFNIRPVSRADRDGAAHLLFLGNCVAGDIVLRRFHVSPPKEIIISHPA